MRMYRCDRCGRIVEGGIRAFVRKPARAGVWHLSKKTHICRDCRDSFDAWMDNGPEEGAAVEEMRGHAGAHARIAEARVRREGQGSGDHAGHEARQRVDAREA